MNEIEESRLVDEARRDTLLYRIIRGKIDYKASYIKEPTLKIKEKGQRIYYDIIKDCIDVLSERDIYLFLLSSNQWTFEEQRKLDALPKELENSKVNYFSNYSSPPQRKYNKIEIQNKKELYRNLFLKRNKYRNLTKQGIANGAMWFEMINFMYNGTDKLAAINYYHSNSISEEDLRSIAIGETWLSYYAAGKNIFGKSSINMTDDQRRLITWSNIYKNCRSNPDCPDEQIVSDHDAFDGWLITERRKNKVTKKIENIKGIDPNATNVYLFSNTNEDHEEIVSLNTPAALAKIENEFKPKPV